MTSCSNTGVGAAWGALLGGSVVRAATELEVDVAELLVVELDVCEVEVLVDVDVELLDVVV